MGKQVSGTEQQPERNSPHIYKELKYDQGAKVIQ